jgi:hypothetical protein
VWGSDVYTDDSSISTAAVHAGVLQPGQLGIVKMTILPGKTDYQGTTRNGVTSSSYGQFPGSFCIELANEIWIFSQAGRSSAYVAEFPGNPSRASPQQDQGNTVQLRTSSGLIPLGKPTAGVYESTSRLATGDTRVIEITGQQYGGLVWGTGPYTADSDLAVAAVHAGLLKPGQKGTIRITVLDGRPSYEGNTQNGVSSLSFGPWPQSVAMELVKLHSDMRRSTDETSTAK